jgi:hypothetical protein
VSQSEINPQHEAEINSEGSPDHGQPFDGLTVYIGRKGLLRMEIVRDPLAFLTAHPANRVWRVTLDNVTEMDATQPTPPRLIVREL